MAKSKHRRSSSKFPSTRAKAESQRPQTVPDAQIYASCLLLVVLVFVVYSPVRHCPFINFDDQAYVTQNPQVQAGLSWDTIIWSITAMEANNWHPLTWISHALDCQFFGLDAGWHHITNVLFHVTNIVMLFLLLRRVTGAPGRSLLVAGLFGLHPFNVGSVAWIAERKNVLSTLLLLLTLAAYGWYARKPQVKRYALVMLFFALGLAAKPMLVTVPFALLLLDYWPLRRVEGWSEESEQFPAPQAPATKLLIEKLPMLALSAASSVLTLIAQREAAETSVVVSYGSRLANAVASYALYIWKTFWPTNFSIYYPHPFATLAIPPGRTAWAAVIIGPLLLIAVSAMAWWQRQTRPYLITGWLWYLGTLLPVIGIVQVGAQGMADRYAYVPLIGIFVIVAWGGNAIAERFHLALAWRQALAALLLLVLAFHAFRELGYWKTSLDLWTHADAVTPNNYFAKDEIGDLLAVEQRPEALQYYEAALKIAPWDPMTHMPLAGYLQDHNLPREAIQQYQVVVQTSPNRHQVAYAYANLCIIFGELGDFERSREAFERAVRNDSKLIEDMVRNLAKTVAAHPSDEGYFGLGLLLQQSGQASAARDAYNQALRLNPELLEAQRALMHLETSDGNPDK